MTIAFLLSTKDGVAMGEEEVEEEDEEEEEDAAQAAMNWPFDPDFAISRPLYALKRNKLASKSHMKFKVIFMSRYFFFESGANSSLPSFLKNNSSPSSFLNIVFSHSTRHKAFIVISNTVNL